MADFDKYPNAAHWQTRLKPNAARSFPYGLDPATRRYHGAMYAVPKPGYDLKTMRAVALAYRRERQAGQLDQPAREAATAAFRARHPELERSAASNAAAEIIAWAAREHSAWFWKGVGLPERR